MTKKKILILGDEAVAQAALDAGISGFYAYPGTPSTEIMEYAQHSKAAAERNVHRAWSANEKTAVEAALGMSYAGKRSMAMMKHVGLNVAMDPFVNSGITGANGGCVITVADDPSMHSSQDEQDSRILAKFALLPALEPSSQQEAYDMVFYAYELSEKYQTPVFMRLTTRLAHSRSGVELREQPIAQNELKLPENKRQFVLLPALAKKSYKRTIANQNLLLEESEKSPWNSYIDAADKSIGIIACGLTYNYLMENFDGNCPYPVLKVCQYPAPKKLIDKLVGECGKILVIEEGAPMLEQDLRGLLDRDVKVMGRISGELPRDGELNPNLVAAALNIEGKIGKPVPELVAPRPPKLCNGCSHADLYAAFVEAVKDKYGDGHLFGDIGCYTLGALPPFQAVNSCVDMGASITMAKGAADAGLFPSCAVIGDSTFTHSGMTGLLDAVIENTNIVVFISDNSTTAMTGGQKSHAEGRLFKIIEGLGVDSAHIRVLLPTKANHDEMVKTIAEEIEYKGVSVIISQRECMQTLRRKTKAIKK